MSSFNKVVIMGNLTREVDLRYTPAGKAVAELNVAVNRKNGDRDEVCFLKVTVWGKLAENCQIYLAKGSSVMVGGHLKQDNWEDRQTGNKRSSNKDKEQPHPLHAMITAVTVLNPLPDAATRRKIAFRQLESITNQKTTATSYSRILTTTSHSERGE